MTETWAPIPRHPGYFASSLGRIKSTRRHGDGRIIKPWRTGKRANYLAVDLATPGRRRGVKRLVHQLVLEAFEGPRPEWADAVRHLNDVGTDNRLVNLAWGTGSQNQSDAVRLGTHGNTRKTRCPVGHPYDEANTYVYVRRDTGRSERLCRSCREAHKRTRTLSSVAAQPSPAGGG